MPKNEDGEFELVLGNRQLLSVFFIVVVLLGVFFTMGYIVGRNSSPGGVDTARKTDAQPIVVNRPSATDVPGAAGTERPHRPTHPQPSRPRPAPVPAASQP